MDNVVAVCDPVYPVYVDTNAMAGRAGDYDGARRAGPISGVPAVYGGERVSPRAAPRRRVPDLIYLCSPNNPTGAAATKEQLKVWVDYANENGAIILYDTAYEGFIIEEEVPPLHL